MIAIVPADEMTRASLLRRKGAPPQTACLLAQTQGEIIGHILFAKEGESICLLDVEPGEGALADGMVRAALNAGREEGAVVAVCRMESLYPLLEGMGFVKSDNCRRVLIREFFNHRSCCP